ncbi:hypothetical protein UFOVP239_70 [uncultured Caudovirales phage]|uniref:Uncharacterized protein n=1 Tax=uncultured Caudovirales phage TaxID=2100421 RepID=A0A6J7WR01_9CAUD|nr:hypothetical protein UFOVP239_70 [uncultured Caudovirales phage]
MGQFKPMVKMYTDEPSVILKLKKGGKVKSKADLKGEHGHKSMHESSEGSAFEAAEHGSAPKKPSMAERRKAMNPNLYAKGGKVQHKQMGGAMLRGGPSADQLLANAPAAGSPAAPVVPRMGGRPSFAGVGGSPEMLKALGPAALGAMDPRQRLARAAMVRKGLAGMKKGGSAGSECAKLEKELKHHEAMSAKRAHGKASGGLIDKAETRTTIESGEKKFAKTKVNEAKHDRARGTGEIKEGKPGGYKHGGKIHCKATGGDIPADSNKRENKGKIVMGGTIEGNEGAYEHTQMHQAEPDHAHGTGGIKVRNAGGFKKGGKVPGIGNAIEDSGNWERRPANSAKPGKQNTSTGEVKEANAGGYKKGGRAKKAYATGGSVVNDGKAEKMPRHAVSKPVANNLQSGTFKKGGKVRMASGGTPPEAEDQAATDANNRAFKEWEKSQRQDNEDTKGMVSDIPGRLYRGVKSLFSSPKPPAGSVTKTEKSVTVAPRKRGGSMRG